MEVNDTNNNVMIHNREQIGIIYEMHDSNWLTDGIVVRRVIGFGLSFSRRYFLAKIRVSELVLVVANISKNMFVWY